MWHFNAIDERRYDHLLGLHPEHGSTHPPASSPSQRRYLLSAAARYCRWRDGLDARRAALSDRDGERIEREMLCNLVPVGNVAGTVIPDPSRTRNENAESDVAGL